MNWQLWKKEEEPEKICYPSGSFLFATDINELQVLSIERIKDFTEVSFRSKDGEVKSPNYHRYFLTLAQHEEFLKAISKDIKSILIPS